MMTPQWLCGPRLDLRPLPEPDTGLTTNVTTAGGVHTSLSGRKTRDIIGHNSQYQISFSYIEPEQYRWLEALYTHLIPSPIYLIDPMRANTLTRRALSARLGYGDAAGLSKDDASVFEEHVLTDPPIPWNYRAVSWRDLTAESFISFDQERPVPLQRDVPMTFSVYVHASEAVTLRLCVDRVQGDSASTSLQSPDLDVPADSWTRLSRSFQFPTDGTDAFRPWVASTAEYPYTTQVLLTSPQLEYGDTASDFDLGSGVSQIEITSFESTSPRYPYRSAEVEFVEV